MSGYPITYQSGDAALLQPIAALANSDLTSLFFIPGGWVVVATLPSSSVGPSAFGTQVLLATNTLPSNPDHTVLVMAFGQTWPGILSPNYFNGATLGTSMSALEVLDPSLGGPIIPPPPPPTAPFFVTAYQQQYCAHTEKRLFAVLSQPAIQNQINGLPLIVVGQALGAPLAQLAALAFRIGRSGLPAKISTSACYTFSTPPMGDTNFNTFFQQQIPASFNVYADRVDFFAAPPTPIPGAIRCGQAVPVTSAIPAIDDPWVEHSGAFYTQLLGGTPSGSSTPGSVTSPPSTYDNDLAYTLAQLCATAYQQAQHPNLPPAPNVASYNLDSVVSSNGIRWGAIFVNSANNRVVLAFRGAVAFEETVFALTQLGVTYPPYLAANAAIAPGTGQIYSALRPALLTQLASALGKAGTSPGILITGHDVGGILANVAALDFAQPGGKVPKPSAIYTFAAPPSGDPVFQGAFNALYASASSPSSFQLARSSDPFPILTVVGGAMRMGSSLALTGTTPADDNINHSLTSFLTLLEPGQGASC